MKDLPKSQIFAKLESSLKPSQGSSSLLMGHSYDLPAGSARLLVALGQRPVLGLILSLTCSEVPQSIPTHPYAEGQKLTKDETSDGTARCSGWQLWLKAGSSLWMQRKKQYFISSKSRKQRT